MILNVFVVLVHLMFVGLHKTYSHKVQHKREPSAKNASSFLEVVGSRTFVDKSLLIKELCEFNGTLRLITTPKGYGKSTNMDMVRIFFEIPVDENGTRINITDTQNFKAFQENNLNIYKDRSYFYEHFGKHPVIYVDYSPLKRISTFESMLEKFRDIISHTYSYHKYLLKNETLWMDEDEMDHFVNHITQKGSRTLDKFDISHSFQYLSILLKRHFGKKVFVLIDNCDAFVYSLIFKDISEMNLILQFIADTDAVLLNSENLIIGALLAGVMRIYRGPEGKNVITYQFLHELQFNKYYGLTESELDEMLNKLLHSDKKREDTKKNIDLMYGGYRVYDNDGTFTTLYNTRSVTNFLKSKNHTSANFLSDLEYMNSFKLLCNVENITVEIQTLLAGNDVEVELHEAFYIEHFFGLNFIIRNQKVLSEYAVEWFCRFLYYLGFLTPAKPLGKLLKGSFKIPNNDIYNKLQSYILPS